MKSLPLLPEQIRELAREELARRGKLPKKDFEREPVVVHDDGTVWPLHDKQREAWNSERRYVAIFAGNQSGKTVLGPYWLLREMARRGPGDYGVIGPDHVMLRNRAKPELAKAMVGMYRSSGDEWIITKAGQIALWGKTYPRESRILFRHALKPEALEAMVLKGLWVDEPGQIDDAVWRAIQPRLMANKARALLTSRPMLFNWYVYEFWNTTMLTSTLERRPDAPEDRDVINYPSSANPNADLAHIEAEKTKMSEAHWRMRYLGIPTRPAGLIYDCWHEDRVVDMVPPDEWARYVGVDFGPDNTCAVFIAAERERMPTGEWGPDTGRYVVYATYHGGGLTPKEYAALWKAHAPTVDDCRGGASTEVGWRGWFAPHWPIGEPKYSGPGSVEVGIQPVYQLVKEKRLFVTKDCADLIREFESYSYKLDPDGEPTGEIDKKSTFHHLDALRYIAPHLIPNRRRGFEFGDEGGYKLS